MRDILTAWTVIVALLVAAFAAAPVNAVSLEDLVVIVNKQAPTSAMSAIEVEALFTRVQTRWSDGTPIVPINAPPGSELRVLFDRVVLRLDPDEVGRFWIDRRIRGMGLPPRQLSEPSTAVRVVEKLAGAVAYMPEGVVRDARVKVVARIQQGKVLPP